MQGEVMSRRLAGAVLALVFAGSAGGELLAIRNKPQASDASKKSPEAAATEALNSGLERLEKADHIERKNPKQARKEYQSALKDFQTATAAAPDNYRAHNGAGYALRKLGHYERALASYERALALAPTSSEAIEYRAEAYLGLNRLTDAKQAYMHLFVHDRAASNVLMKAMKRWVEKHRAQAAGVELPAIDAFDAWVRERDTLASSVVNLGHNSPDWK
jgi:tetratricopeptide (TPR) repeat protein